MQVKPKITLSIVSHGQGQLVNELLQDIAKVCGDDIEVLVTLNIVESVPFKPSDFAFPLRLIKNDTPKGFGANHNAAFKYCQGDFFCVLNPDIRLSENPFDLLLEGFKDKTVGVVAPCVCDLLGNMQDSVRKFPTPWSILCRTLFNKREADYVIERTIIDVDWFAGMFMLFPSAIFRQLGGFDERYFLYCEDIDICARLHVLDYKVQLNPLIRVQHDARRDSQKKLRYMLWHLKSLALFFSRYYFGFLKKQPCLSWKNS